MSELEPDQWRYTLKSEQAKGEKESVETLLNKLVGALENDESFTTYSAQALARAYELKDRLDD